MRGRIIRQVGRRSANTLDNLAINALLGTFRFISGNSSKQAYSIKTPTATMGIRGTKFDFTVRRRGDTDVVLFSGQVDVCGRSGCIRLNEACSLASITRNGDARRVRSSESRNRQIRARFPYIVSQAPLRRDFRVSTRSCGDIQKALISNEPQIRASTAANRVAPPAPEPPEPEPPDQPGNPGNGRSSGNAGPSPGGNDMGDRERGRSDTNGAEKGDSGRGRGGNSGRGRGGNSGKGD